MEQTKEQEQLAASGRAIERRASDEEGLGWAPSVTDTHASRALSLLGAPTEAQKLALREADLYAENCSKHFGLMGTYADTCADCADLRVASILARAAALIVNGEGK